MPRSTKRERELWQIYWTKPQALMWEANGQEIEVAVHVRTLAEAEQRGIWQKKGAAGLRNLVKQQLENLGLSQPGLARNHWIIDAGSPDEVQAPARGAEQPIEISDARERLRAAANAS